MRGKREEGLRNSSKRGCKGQVREGKGMKGGFGEEHMEGGLKYWREA